MQGVMYVPHALEKLEELTWMRRPKHSMFILVAGTASLSGINLFLAKPCLTSITSPATPWPSTFCR